MSAELTNSKTASRGPESSLPASRLATPEPIHRRPRLMLVDDNDAFLSAMQLLLPRLFDIEIVASAQSGPEALERLATTAVDLVMIDYKMPGLNGLTVARRARENQIRTRILLVTFNPSPALVADARDCGADGIINKAEIQQDLQDYLPRWFGGGTDSSEDLK